MRDPMMSGYWAAPLADDALTHAHRCDEIALALVLVGYAYGLGVTIAWVCYNLFREPL